MISLRLYSVNIAVYIHNIKLDPNELPVHLSLILYIFFREKLVPLVIINVDLLTLEWYWLYNAIQ